MTTITSKKKANAISGIIFLVGMIILIIVDIWWPGIMLVIGIPFALRQYLLGRTYDMCISLLVFVGTFITVQFDIAWRIFLPILFSLGSIYVLGKEFIAPTPDEEIEDEEEKDEDIQHEIEEKK